MEGLSDHYCTMRNDCRMICKIQIYISILSSHQHRSKDPPFSFWLSDQTGLHLHQSLYRLRTRWDVWIIKTIWSSWQVSFPSSHQMLVERMLWSDILLFKPLKHPLISWCLWELSSDQVELDKNEQTYFHWCSCGSDCKSCSRWLSLTASSHSAL